MAKTLLIAVALPLYALLFGEAFVRLLSPVAIVPRYVQATEYGIRGNDPNKSYRHVGPEYDVQIRTNAQGMRADREFEIEKPTDVYRIVLLGDSFGMGYEVSLEDSFASRLEHHFELTTGIPCEVINLSTSGHGTAEELIVLRKRGLAYKPDLVLLCWHRTDYKDNVRSNLFTLNNGVLERASTTYLPGVELRKKLFALPGYTFIAENSQLYNLVREKAAHEVKDILTRLRSSPTAESKPQSEPKDAKTTTFTKQRNRYANTYEESLAIALLERIKSETKLAGAEFLILDIPQRRSRTSFTSTLPTALNPPSSNLLSYCPIEDFAAYKGEKLYWEKGHGHFTPLACDIVGQGLAREIAQLKVGE